MPLASVETAVPVDVVVVRTLRSCLSRLVFALLTLAVFSGGLVARINLASTVSMTVASSSDSIATLRFERMKRETSAPRRC